MNEEEMAQAAPAPDEQEPKDDSGEESQEPTEKGPLERIEVEPAEDGGAIVTHHKKMSSRVKHADYESIRPKKHVFESKEAAAKHVMKHIHRLKS